MPSSKEKKRLWKRPDLRLADVKKVVTLNIGTILFGAIFLYMLISLILYLTATHITPYQVTSGPLSQNQTYMALVMREEQLVQATIGGTPSYYVRENTKVKKLGAVYGVGDGTQSGNSRVLSEEDLARVRADFAQFSNSFNSNNFSETYSFKYEIEGSLLQYAGLMDNGLYEGGAGTEAGAEKSMVSTSRSVGGQTVSLAPADGLVLFSKDGYEALTVEELTEEHFNRRAYQKKNLRTSASLNAGDDVYKLVTSEDWSLLIPLTDAQIVRLAGRENIRVKFLKDGITQTGRFTIVTSNDRYYAKIDFSSGMLRYAADRFLDIELVTNTRTGLKIPVSSIVNKDFYVIPVGFETTGGESDERGFLKETMKDGESSTEFVNATVYAQQDEYFYVDASEFSEGDVIIKPESTERYTIQEQRPLEGVYSINRGYAVFRRVIIIDQNEEYCIVESGTPYGIAQFDNIVSDSSTVKEEEILY